MTHQREIILNVIHNSGMHMTADQIYRAAKEMCPSIALATVYRNLGIMAEAGDIMRISIPGEPDRFDKNTFPHGHAKCVMCGKVTDLDISDLKDILIGRTGMDIISCDINVSFICPECRPDLKD